MIENRKYHNRTSQFTDSSHHQHGLLPDAIQEPTVASEPLFMGNTPHACRPTFGEFARVSTARVQWPRLALGEPSS